MKLTNQELQKLRHQEALDRIAAEDKADIARAEEIRQKWSAVMPCCGAPKDKMEPTDKYYDRHRKGKMGYPISPACEPALICARYRGRSKGKGRIRHRTEIGMEDASCCGAPMDEPYPTRKYVERHRDGRMGTPMSDECEWARACQLLYWAQDKRTYRERKKNA